MRRDLIASSIDPNTTQDGCRRIMTGMLNPQQGRPLDRAEDTRTPDVRMTWGETVPAACNGHRH